MSVAAYRFLTVAEPGEDVRRHVQRVRRGRGDFRIAAGRPKARLGKPWRVIAMDQVVRHARMVRLLGEDRLEDRCGALLFA